MGKKDTGLGEVVAAPTRLTPADIQQKEFRVSRFGGYKMRDVDEFLDQITDSFTALTADVDRLRAGAAPVVGTPDLGDVARQADEIIARARAEAARILAEARATAATGSTASPNGPQERAAVTAFIAQEREFLQSLAGLVQEHAETVKGMAKSARSSPEATAAAAPRQGSEAKAEPVTTESASERPSGPQTNPPAGRGSSEATTDDTTRVPESDDTTRVPESDDTVRIVEEPATAAASRGEADSEGDRSLRELFWGED